MAKFFSTNKSFTDYIQMIGFKYTETNTEKKYYTNKFGNQIKIDYSEEVITLLNKKGNVVDYSNTFTNEQIDKFSIRDN